jgi:hypothetical protein
MTTGARGFGRHKAVWLAIAAIAVAALAAAAAPRPSGLAETDA